ncbi:MAG: hypothetical protein MJZ05_10375 [Fibrobacter sp.]|nr:hypothetical protein [Fibrobacter sp.]
MPSQQLLDLIAFCETLAPIGEGHKPEARWMPWDCYVAAAKKWNEKHPDDLCEIGYEK